MNNRVTATGRVMNQTLRVMNQTSGVMNQTSGAMTVISRNGIVSRSDKNQGRDGGTVIEILRIMIATTYARISDDQRETETTAADLMRDRTVVASTEEAATVVAVMWRFRNFANSFSYSAATLNNSAIELVTKPIVLARTRTNGMPVARTIQIRGRTEVTLTAPGRK
jgi:hypothetical protein